MLFLPALFSGCGTNSENEWDEIRSTAEITSEETERKAYLLFKNSYELDGKVVKIEEHPVSPLSSSGAHYIIYHIEYQMNSALLGTNEGKGWVKPGKGPKYLLQITEFRYSPKFKVGDSVQITGWMKKTKLNKVASPNGETADANSP
jgi:hypothetical protein